MFVLQRVQEKNGNIELLKAYFFCRRTHLLRRAVYLLSFVKFICLWRTVFLPPSLPKTASDLCALLYVF